MSFKSDLEAPEIMAPIFNAAPTKTAVFNSIILIYSLKVTSDFFSKSISSCWPSQTCNATVFKTLFSFL